MKVNDESTQIISEKAKVEKKKSYYNKLVKQPWGVIDAYPPKERLEWERIKNLSKQKWIRKFPPLAAMGEDTYKRLKNHGEIGLFHPLKLQEYHPMVIYCGFKVALIFS